LCHLREKLIQDKIRGIQHVILELIQQNISILEKYLEDYIATRLANLEQERQIIVQHQEQLYQEIAAIPSSWVSEKMIHQHVELSEKLMAEVAKMVEAKNISTNLEVVQSTPVDYAALPIHPKPPHVVLFTVLGAFLGMIFSGGYLFGSAMIKGLKISLEQLN